MNRKSFIKTGLIAGAAAGFADVTARPLTKKGLQKKHPTDFYELRIYELKDQQQQKMVEDYFKDAAIPALNRLGSKHIGVFTEMKPEGQTKLFVLIPFDSIEAFLNMEDQLVDDVAHQQNGSAYLQAPATAPAYERIDSSVLQAFSSTPHLIVPEKGERFFELRRYESASELTGKKKIEMFNDAGETAIFKKLGFNPVFFAETLIGEMRPNLTYMITFKNMEDHDAKWKSFGNDADWKKISSMPEYSDKKNVSRITSTFLLPTDFSQV